MKKKLTLIFLLILYTTPVLAWSAGDCNSDTSDTGGTAKACSTISHSQDGVCVKSSASVNVRGETRATVDYNGSTTISVETSSTGSGIASISGGGNHYKSDWKKGGTFQKTTAYGYWPTYSMSWGGQTRRLRRIYCKLEWRRYKYRFCSSIVL